MPFLSKQFDQEKRISILNLCLCCAKTGKIRLGSCFQRGRYGSFGTLAVREYLDYPCFSSDLGKSKED